MELYKPEPKENEDFRTILNTITDMPDSVRHSFFKSHDGQEIIKGLELQDETDKKYTGAKHQMDKKELDELWLKLYHSSVEQRQAIISMLPGPVIAVLLDNLKEPATMPDRNERAEIHKSLELEKGIRGPVKGTPGYEQWVQKLRATRAAKKQATEAAQSSSGAPPAAAGKPKEGPVNVPTEPVKPYKEHEYKHFIRQVGKHGETIDKPSGEKS
jgi:hypothetical protein